MFFHLIRGKRWFFCEAMFFCWINKNELLLFILMWFYWNKQIKYIIDSEAKFLRKVWEVDYRCRQKCLWKRFPFDPWQYFFSIFKHLRFLIDQKYQPRKALEITFFVWSTTFYSPNWQTLNKYQVWWKNTRVSQTILHCDRQGGNLRRLSCAHKK